MRLVLGGAEAVVTRLALDDTVPELDAAPTVEVVSSDGTALPDITPTAVTDPPLWWSVGFTPDHTAALDRLTVTMTGTANTVPVRHQFSVEVVSSRLFDLVSLRSMPDMGDTQRFPLANLQAARDWIEGIVEAAVGTSFCERVYIEQHRADATTTVWVNALHSYELRSVAVDGVDSPGWTLTPDGALTAPTAQTGTVTVVYTSGYSTHAPDEIATAALIAARARVLASGSSGIPDRSRGMSNEFGNLTFSVAGVNAPTGFPEVDAVLLRWRDRFHLPGIG